MFGTAAWKAANRSRATADSNSFEGLLRPVWLIILDAYSAVEWTTQHSLHPLFTLNRCYHQQVTAAISNQHSEKRPPRSLRRKCTNENLKGLRYWVADDMKNYHPLLQKICINTFTHQCHAKNWPQSLPKRVPFAIGGRTWSLWHGQACCCHGQPKILSLTHQ
jgi:hypothetical protein